jgi:hypothetical protein
VIAASSADVEAGPFRHDSIGYRVGSRPPPASPAGLSTTTVTISCW